MERHGAPVWRKLDGDLIQAVVRRDGEALVPVHLAHSFLATSARSAGITNLGYMVGGEARIQGLGAFGRNLMRSLTLYDALCKIRSMFALYSSAERLWWVQSGSNVVFLHRHLHETGSGRRDAQQCALLLMRDLVRLAAGPGWQPGVILVAPDQDTRASQETFETDDVRQGTYSGFVFPAEFLSRPFERFRGSADSDRDPTAFEASAPATDFAGSVKQTIAALVRDSCCQLNVIAEALGTHPRTLQRNLSGSNIEFSKLLAEVRFETAVRLLDDDGRRIIDIAFELGYADSANFTRAFRQWTGVSPSDFRRLRQQSSLSRNDMTSRH